MNPCGSCGYSARQGATLVALISIAHFILQLIIVCIFGRDAGTTTTEDGETHQIGIASDEGYYALIATQILMIFMSVLLFVGVRYWSVCMILPWIVTTAVADIGYFTLMVAAFIFTMTKFHALYLGAFIATLFLFTIVTYLLWIVIYFMLDILAQPAVRSDYDEFDGGLSKDGTKKSRKAKKGKGWFGRGGDRSDQDGDRSVKETPVSKYLLRDTP